MTVSEDNEDMWTRLAKILARLKAAKPSEIFKDGKYIGRRDKKS